MKKNIGYGLIRTQVYPFLVSCSTNWDMSTPLTKELVVFLCYPILPIPNVKAKQPNV